MYFDKVILRVIQFWTLWFFILRVVNFQKLDFHWVKFNWDKFFFFFRKELTFNRFNWGLISLPGTFTFIKVVWKSIELIIPCLFELNGPFDSILQHFTVYAIFLCNIRSVLLWIFVFIIIFIKISYVVVLLVITSHQLVMVIDLVNLFVFVR